MRTRRPPPVFAVTRHTRGIRKQLQGLTADGLGLPHVWGSGSGSQSRVGVVRWREPLSEGGTEGAVVDSAADLQQKIGTPSSPAHLLRLVHSAVHQEIGRSLGDGRPNA